MSYSEFMSLSPTLVTIKILICAAINIERILGHELAIMSFTDSFQFFKAMLIAVVAN